MHNDEDGLTLVEMMVALVVTGIVLMAMASVAIASMASIQLSERVVRSTQLGNEVIEDYHATPYESLGLYESEAQAHFGGTSFEGDDLVILSDPDEPRDLDDPDPTDPVPYPVRTVERDGITYTVETAVVWTEDQSAQDFKRVIVLMSWTHKGTERTARVEALRTPGPDEQPLTVTIIPDVIDLEDDDIGKATENITILVEAREPQSSVKATYLDRNGDPRTVTLDPTDQWDTQWIRVLDNNGTNRRFTNGGTLFEVTGWAVAGNTESTTIGRALFLHPLRIPSDRLWATPNILRVHPDGPCTGLEILVDVRGAIKSDPLTLRFEDDPEPDPDEPQPSLAFKATDDVLKDGTRYVIDVDEDRLPVEHDVNGDMQQMRVYLEIERPADGETLSQPVDVPVESVATAGDC